MENNTN